MLKVHKATEARESFVNSYTIKKLTFIPGTRTDEGTAGPLAAHTAGHSCKGPRSAARTIIAYVRTPFEATRARPRSGHF